MSPLHKKNLSLKILAAIPDSKRMTYLAYNSLKATILTTVFMTTSCSVSPTATFNDNSFSGVRQEIVDFAEKELRPTAQIGLIIDNSNSMKDEQKNIASGIEKMVRALKGFNVDIYTISTTPLEGIHQINTGGSRFGISLPWADDTKTFHTYRAIDGLLYGKSFMSVENLTIRNHLNELTDKVPVTGNSILNDELPWKINFEFKTLPSATNGGKPFKVLADMTEAEINLIAEDIKSQVQAFGTNGSSYSYGACALYRMARDMMPAGKTTSFFLLSDGNDQSDHAVNTGNLATRTISSMTVKGLSYCSDSSQIDITSASQWDSYQTYSEEQIQAYRAQDPDGVKVNYPLVTKRVSGNYTADQLVDGRYVRVENKSFTVYDCGNLKICDNVPDYGPNKGNLSAPYNMNAAEKAAIARRFNLREDSISLAQLTHASSNTSWQPNFIFPYSDVDYRTTSFTKEGKTYSNIYDYMNQLHGKSHHVINSTRRIWYVRRSDGYFKVYPRTTTFQDSELGALLSNKNDTFSNSLGNLFIKEAQKKFPLFSFSAIINDPDANAAKACPALSTGEEYGVIYKNIADNVNSLGTKSIGKVNAVCSSSYDEYIESIKSNFIEKNASLIYELPTTQKNVVISSLRIIDSQGKRIPLHISRDITELHSHDAVVNGFNVTFNEESLKKALDLDSIDSEVFKNYKLAVTYSATK